MLLRVWMVGGTPQAAAVGRNPPAGVATSVTGMGVLVGVWVAAGGLVGTAVGGGGLLPGEVAVGTGVRVMRVCKGSSAAKLMPCRGT